MTVFLLTLSFCLIDHWLNSISCGSVYVLLSIFVMSRRPFLGHRHELCELPMYRCKMCVSMYVVMYVCEIQKIHFFAELDKRSK
jgi:hypothetical protein